MNRLYLFHGFLHYAAAGSTRSTLEGIGCDDYLFSTDAATKPFSALNVFQRYPTSEALTFKIRGLFCKAHSEQILLPTKEKGKHL